MDFPNSDFANKADITDGWRTPDLSNAIHPLFAASKFPQLDAAQYAQMHLPLKLASRMLDDDRAVKYVLTMEDGYLHLIQNNLKSTRLTSERLQKNSIRSNARLMRCSRLAPGASLTPTDRIQARTVLEQLANTLEGYRTHDPVATGQPYEFTKFCDTIKMDPTTRDFFPLGEQGLKSYISIQHDTMFGFLDYPVGCFSLVKCYLLARVLVHELAHVLHQSCFGIREEAVFYEESIHNEAGFELEVALFGSITQLDSAKPWVVGSRPDDVILTMWEYPSTIYVQVYDKPETTRIVMRQNMDDYATIQRMPSTFAANMFNDKFWNDEVPSMVGPICPTDPYSWLIKLIRSGQSYTDRSGGVVVADSDCLEPCSFSDTEMPPSRKLWLGQIIQDRMSRTLAGIP